MNKNTIPMAKNYKSEEQQFKDSNNTRVLLAEIKHTLSEQRIFFL
jgi:hypothetical protein